MPKLRLKNDSDEVICVEPGEAIDLQGESEILRGPVARRDKFVAEGER